jgi:hypothetical protein
MANLTSALQQLREERKQAHYHVEKLESAISVLEDLVGRNGSLTRTAAGGSRVVTAMARRRMAAAAQRARGPKARQSALTPHINKPRTTSSPKRTLSAAARRKIAAAQRARWARVKAQQGKKAA